MLLEGSKMAVKSPEYLLSRHMTRETGISIAGCGGGHWEDFYYKDEIDYALGRGSGYEHGAFHIYEYFMEGHDQKGDGLLF